MPELSLECLDYAWTMYDVTKLRHSHPPVGDPAAGALDDGHHGQEVVRLHVCLHHLRTKGGNSVVTVRRAALQGHCFIMQLECGSKASRKPPADCHDRQSLLHLHDDGWCHAFTHSQPQDKIGHMECSLARSTKPAASRP